MIRKDFCMDNIDFVFVGKCSDFVASKKYLSIEKYKALCFTETDNIELSEQENSITKNTQDISSYCNEQTLLIASSLSKAKDSIFQALEQGSSILLLNYKDITFDDYAKLQSYNSKSIIAFCVPIFANSKSALIKRMIDMYGQKMPLDIYVNDVENHIFESDLSLLSLNLINKENVKDIEIEKVASGLKMITKDYTITLTHDTKRCSYIRGSVVAKSWKFEWEILGNLNSYHANGVKESYAHSKENTKEHIYKNAHLNCLGATQILYTSLDDFSIFMAIREKFNTMGNEKNIQFNID